MSTPKELAATFAAVKACAVSTPDDLLEAYTAAYEKVGGHPNSLGRALGIAAVLELVADDIDAGPPFPLAPSVISALLREKAEHLVRAMGGPDSREGED